MGVGFGTRGAAIDASGALVHGLDASDNDGATDAFAVCREFRVRRVVSPTLRWAVSPQWTRPSVPPFAFAP